MGDQSVREALRSTSRLVVIEAPAGCGKTHQGAEYAQDVVTDGWQQRLLVLTHTHSACSVFSDRANARTRKQMDVRTIDSFIGSIASAYHVGLSLPSDIASWIRQTKDGHSQVATKVAALLCHRPMIAAALVARHPIVICDEHQDSNGDQSAVVMALLDQGARLRVFADPMQKIFKEKTVPNAKSPQDWGALIAKADAFEVLDTPHRWETWLHAIGFMDAKSSRDPEIRWTDRFEERIAGKCFRSLQGERSSTKSRLQVDRHQ